VPSVEGVSHEKNRRAIQGVSGLRGRRAGQQEAGVDLNQKNKLRVWEFWQALECVGDAQAASVAHQFMSGDTLWHGPDPINELLGVEAFAEEYWSPLQHAFSGLERQTHLFMAGKSNGRADGSNDGQMWVGGTGLFNGRFNRDYLSIPATGGEVHIRWGEFCRMERGRIVEIFCLLDLVDLMQQAGCSVLPPGRGEDHLHPPPRAGDGVMLDAQDPWESQHSLEQIRRFIFEDLNADDDNGPQSMGLADFFHSEAKWYGPGGIGACRDFEEFENLHQKYWLQAFSDRTVRDLDALIAEGPYSGAAGWGGVLATHQGPYLDQPATGRTVEINGLDFWKREGEVFVENWVFVDMVHLFRQMGVDLFDRIA
jgi:predicted ester cyclase